MSAHWRELFSSLAIIAVVLCVWTNVQDYLRWLKGPAKERAFGAFMGAGAILAMMMPYEYAPGLIIDVRSALVATAGFFGGPLAGAIAAAAAGVYRLFLGGVGAWPGAFGIGMAALVGLAGRRLVGARPVRRSDVLLLAIATPLAGLPSMLLLPDDMWRTILPQTAGPVFALGFVGTMLAGLAIFEGLRRRDLLTSNLAFRAIIETLPDPLNAKDRAGRFIAANPATAALMKAGSARELVGKTDFDFYPPAIAERFRADEEAVMAIGETYTIEQSLALPDGTQRWLSTLKAPLRDGEGRLLGLVTHNRDITRQKALSDELRTAQQQLEDALAHMADGLALYDQDGVLLFCNEQYRKFYPTTADLRVPGVRLRDLLRASVARGEQPRPATDDFEAWLTERCGRILAASSRTIEFADGTCLEARTRPASNGCWLILFTDITVRKRYEEALAAANSQLQHLAVTDALTGLTNRRGFDAALEREFARSQREGTPLSLALIDVDKFKLFNDTYGHVAGDDCLARVGRQLRVSVNRPADLSARYGGEELAMLLPNTPGVGAYRLAEAFRLAIEALAIAHSGNSAGHVTVSIGIATSHPGLAAASREDLISQADKALYAAKNEGRNQTCAAPSALPAGEAGVSVETAERQAS